MFDEQSRNSRDAGRRNAGGFQRRSRQPHCAEPFDVQDVPLLGYDGAPSTQRHLSTGGRPLDRR